MSLVGIKLKCLIFFKNYDVKEMSWFVFRVNVWLSWMVSLLLIVYLVFILKIVVFVVIDLEKILLEKFI